jgi:hypothetical protein
MKMIMILVLMTFITSSCSAGGFYRGIICRALKNSEIRPIVWCSVAITEKFTKCNCRCLNFNTFTQIDDNKCGNFTSGNYPLIECNGIQGAHYSDIGDEIMPKMRKIDKLKKDYCK